MINDKLNELVKDLTIEFQVGGDRFDRSDMALSLFTAGLNKDNMEEFRDAVRASATCEICSADFVEKQLDYWVPDWICELGEFESNRKDRGEFLATGRVSPQVFYGFDKTDPDNGYTELFNLKGDRLHDGVIPCKVDTEKHSLQTGFSVVDGTLFALTDIDQYSVGDHPGILRVNTVTGEADQFAVKDEQCIRLLKEADRNGLDIEVVSSAFDALDSGEAEDLSDAVRIGAREWDVQEQPSKGMHM